MKISPQLADLVLAHLDARADCLNEVVRYQRFTPLGSEYPGEWQQLKSEADGFWTACALLIDPDQWAAIADKARKVESPTLPTHTP